MGDRYRAANQEMRSALARVAPGTGLREGIERVVRSKAGALVVLSDAPEVLAICSGGFLVDSPFSPQRLSELAKMDGAIILTTDGARIARANVHLVPEPSVPTSETGTRHRTAERVARSLDVPVVSASEEMGVINVYAGGTKRQLQPVSSLLDRANQALQTLQRYKDRLDESVTTLTTLEIEDLVTVKDVVNVLQRGEMVERIADEIYTMIVELGVEARLLRLQMEELFADSDRQVELIIADYLPPARHVEDTIEELSRLKDDEVLDARTTVGTLHLGAVELTDELQPRGVRVLSHVNSLTPDLAAKVAADIGGLARLHRVSVDELTAIDGIDETLARDIKDTMQRVTEATILEQYN